MAKDNYQSHPSKTFSDVPREVLDEARMAGFIQAAKTEKAKAFVQELTSLTINREAATMPRQRVRKTDDHKSFQRAVGAFAADLIHHAGYVNAQGFMYRPRDKDSLSETLVSDRHFVQLTELWHSMGLIDKTSFIRIRETFEDELIGVFFARASRMRATPRLLEFAANYGITPVTTKDHFERQTGLTRPVTIRDERRDANGKKIASRNIRITGAAFDREMARVRELNRYLARGGFDLSDLPQVYRLFNRGNLSGFAFNMGGRLYCASEDNWQNISSGERAKITQRGKATVEIDVRASYLHILYALHGEQLPDDLDPYEIPGIDRDVVKGMLVAVIGNGGRFKRWPRKMNEDYLAKTGRKLSKSHSLATVTTAVFEHHPILAKVKPGKFDWARLQYEESECFLSALLELGRNHEVTALPVHDSLIVGKKDQELATDILGLAYERRVGSRPIIRDKAAS